MFEKLKKFYDMGLYTKEQLKVFVARGIISQRQYDKIVEKSE